MEAFGGAVLTGGQSRRMGRDKALVAVDGVPMVLRVAAALHAAGAAEVHAVGGDRAALVALGLDALDDPRQGEGPLGGLLTALDLAGPDLTVVLATDLAWIDAGTIAQLVVAAATAPVAVARTDRLEPLCAAWRRSRCAAPLAAAYAGGERAVHRALAILDHVAVTVSPRAVANANTPADLHR